MCIIIIVCFNTGCDKYWIKKPKDYHNTIWISQNPYLELIVDNEGMLETKFKIDGELENVSLKFKAESAICYRLESGDYEVRDESTMYFYAECEYSKEKCVLKLKEKKEGILEGVDEIVLVKQAYKDKVD